MKPSIAQRLIALTPKGRTCEETAQQLEVPFEEAKAFIDRPVLPKGYELVRWTSHSGGTYSKILAPEPVLPKLQPREFRMERASEPESYLRVVIPDDVKDVHGKRAKFIEIFPFSDVHWGHYQCDKKNFLLDVKEVERRPNRFAILNGDNLENSLGDSAGGAAWAEQTATPLEQRDQSEVVYRRIAHKILAVTPGNHEWRSEMKTLLNPLKEIAKGLNVEYFKGPYNMEILWRGYRWTFHIKHGRGNSNTPGGKINNAARERHYNDFRNFFCSGHVHDELTDRFIRRIPRREFKNGKLERFWIEKVKEYVVIFPSYLLYSGTYAEEAGYSPGSRNTIAIQLYGDNGDYHVVSSKRRQNADGTETVIEKKRI